MRSIRLPFNALMIAVMLPAWGAANASDPDVAAIFANAGHVPVTATNYVASGKTVNLVLGFAPAVGTDLKVVDNTGLDFIDGAFGNLAHGQVVVLTHGGQNYRFVTDYYGGTGNDLVLRWGIQRLVGWGLNSHPGGGGGTPTEGQIGDGDGTTLNRTVPMPAGNTGALTGKFILSLASGGSHSLALCSDGTLAAWGSNYRGQLGNGTTTSSATPVAVNMSGALAGKRVVAVSAGLSDSLALCSDGTVYAWGALKGQQSGQSIATSTTPIAVDMSGALAGKSVAAIAAGGYHNLVLCTDGSLFAWGSDQFGVLGNMDIIEYQQSAVAVPVQDVNGVFIGRTPVSISAGVSHNLVLCSDGVLVAWGVNELTGAVGDGSNLNRNVPVLVNMGGALAGKTVVKALAGGHGSMALCSDGTLTAWGFGQNTVGNGTIINVHAPVALNSFGALAGGNVVNAGRGSLNGIALLENGTLTAWGNNQFGGLGIGTTTPEFSLVPVAVSQVSLAEGEVFGGLVCGGSTQHAFVLGGAGGYLDDPGEVAFSSHAVPVFPGAAQAFVKLTRTGGAAATSVTLTTSNGSASLVPPFNAALAGTDYTALTTVLDFAEGETSKVVPITLLPRSGTLPNRRFTVSLASPTGDTTLGSISSTEVRLLAIDTTQPTLTVTTPAATATALSTLSPFLIKGVAGDAKGIDRVEVVLNGGVPVNAVMGAATSNTLRPYSLNVEPLEGATNTLAVTAFDLSGNSRTVTRSFSFTRRYNLAISRIAPDGVALEAAGSVMCATTPASAASALAPTTANANPRFSAILPGTPVKLTAMPKTGYSFSHWSALPDGALPLGNVATFTMPSEDVAATAVFVANPFLATAGQGNGFFGLLSPFDSTPVSNSTVGFFTGTIMPNGGFTGKILIDGATHAIAGTFYGDGSILYNVGTTKTYERYLGGLRLELFYGMAGIVATLFDDTDVVVTGTARRAVSSMANKVPAELLNQKTVATALENNKGFFTVAMPARTPQGVPQRDTSTYPQGDGLGTISLSDTGAVSFAGTLADGSTYTAASGIVTGYECPVFAQLGTPGAAAMVKGGSLGGMLLFDNSEADSDVTATSLLWIRPAVTELPGTTPVQKATQLYTDGWPEGILLDAVGALYDKTRDVQDALGLGPANSIVGNGRLGFEHGKLAAALEETSLNIAPGTTAGTSLVTKIPTTNTAFTLMTTQSSGAFSGTFTPNWNQAAAAKPAFKGILLQKGASAGGYGFFLSNRTGDTNPESGRVTLGPLKTDPLNPAYLRIEGGTFQQGDSDVFSPVHTVHVSTFYMQETETSKGQWDAVRAWGLNNGYTDLPAGAGASPEYPVQAVSWHAVVKWCNARSEMEGLAPCYYTDAAHASVYRTGTVDLDIGMVDWTASGHRLPTESEWEKAARGGLAGARFPWGNTIRHLKANYYSDKLYSYDVNPTAGYHPASIYNLPPSWYSIPVGLLPANGHGLKDMAGNVHEWCWDRLENYTATPKTDPKGAAAGVFRITRGGSGSESAVACRCASRFPLAPDLDSYPDLGFRTARSAP
jgi:formylglycine-generating enzyme required for sulfatase activity/alpha-tubulin suppressor-like RCC1 family protein